jgi:hypothetical protein
MKGPSRHVPSECWIKFPDKLPQRMKDSKSKSSPNGKFNTNLTNQSKHNADKWKNFPSMFKKETAKAMVTIRQSGEFTNEELNQTQNIVDAIALYSVKDATGAKRRNYNKLRKSLARHGQKIPENQPYKPAAKAILPPINERTRNLCKKCERMAKHQFFECKYQPASGYKATIEDVNRPGKKLELGTMKKSKANFTASQNQDVGRDEETRYLGSFGTKATEDNKVHAHFTYYTSAMDFGNVITNAGSNRFLHGTDSQGNFMDVYGTRSRGPQSTQTCNCS